MTDSIAGPSKLDGEVEDDERREDPVAPQQEVLWEVGSVSDVSVSDEKERRGVGGGNTRGERRGLLIDEEEEAEEGEQRTILKRPRDDGDPFVEEDEEGFGDYEGVAREDIPSPTSIEKS